MKTLLELVENIGCTGEEDVIFAREKWSPTSEAGLFSLTEGDRLPEEPQKIGLKYFLEVHIAREVLEGLEADPCMTALKKCERLIHYALNDA